MVENKAAIVILNYNGWQDTKECVNSLIKSGISAEIIVVDNCSTDDSFMMLSKNLPTDVVLLETEKNIGYAAGNNVGIKYAIEKQCTHICILNNDTIVKEDFLEICVKYLEHNKSVAFVGPVIIDFFTGLVQSSGGSIYINKGYADQKNNGVMRSSLAPVIESDYIGGACIVFRSDLIDKIGFIPESYFLFYEETEWCYKALKAGYKNICITDVCVIHKGSVSIKKIGVLNEYLLARNKIAFLRRNHPNKVYAFFVYIYYCIKTVAETIIKGPKRIKRIKYYTHGWFRKIDLEKYPFIYIKE